MSSGRDFVAVVRLSTKANETLALPGETCERVPAASLEWLERGNKIRFVSQGAGGTQPPPKTMPADELPNYPRGRRMKPSEGA